jgi:hypothetical protein
VTKENRPGARAALGEADQEKISNGESTKRPKGNTSTAYVITVPATEHICGPNGWHDCIACIAEALIELIDRNA